MNRKNTRKVKIKLQIYQTIFKTKQNFQMFKEKPLKMTKTPKNKMKTFKI